MSKDDVGPKRPPREEDPSYITMPPELRAYDTGPLEDTAIKPGDDPILDAAVAGIRVLDGDPNADPFYYDVRKRRAEAKKKGGAGAGNATAYVPPTRVPSASEVKAGEAAPSKVVIAEQEDPFSTRAIDVRAFRGMSAGVRPVTGGEGEEPAPDHSEEPASDASQKLADDATEKPPEAAPSPWSKEAASPESVRASALPSSLRPGGVPTSTSEKQVAASGRDRTKTKVVITVALVIVALGIGVAALTIRRTPENGSQGPLPTATMTPAPPTVRTVSPPAPAPSAMPVPPPASGAMAPAVPPSATTAPGRQHPAPRPSSTSDDPYVDAAVKPIPAVTAPPQPPAAPVSPPTATTNTPPPTPPVKSPVEGDRVFGN